MKFLFLPGEKLLHIVGGPGPDTDDCEIIEDSGGDTVKIKFQVYGQGDVFVEDRPRDAIMWKRNSETAKRYRDWLIMTGQT